MDSVHCSGGNGQSEWCGFTAAEWLQTLTERTVRLAGAQLRALLDASPVPVFLVDVDGIISAASSSASGLAGLQPASLKGMPLACLVADEERERLAHWLKRLRRGNSGAGDLRLQFVRPSGQRRICHVTGTGVEEGNRRAGIMVFAEDITDRLAETARLRHAERHAGLGRLLGEAGHELSSPLTTIVNFADALLTGQVDEPQRVLEVIHREAQRAAQVSNALRTALCFPREQRLPEWVPVDVNDVVRHILVTRESQLSAAHIRVELELAQDLPPVSGYRGQLEQVVLNLLANAQQALAKENDPAGGHIRVATRSRGEEVVLLVMDDGPGIQEEDLERVFEPFWSTKPVGVGMGLGLSVTARIVAEHQGRIVVDSKPGCGTCFKVQLPACREDKAPEVASRQHDAGPGGRSTNGLQREPLRILVVDDDAAIRSMLTVCLNRRGHSTEGASGGEEALHLIRQAPTFPAFDIILTDLRMPDIDGKSLHGEIVRRHPELRGRMIFVSGDVVPQEMAHSLGHTKVPVISKPFQLADVYRMVEQQAVLATSKDCLDGREEGGAPEGGGREVGDRENGNIP